MGSLKLSVAFLFHLFWITSVSAQDFLPQKIETSTESFTIAIIQNHTVPENNTGEIKIIEGAAHDRIRQFLQSFQLISKWFSRL